MSAVYDNGVMHVTWKAGRGSGQVEYVVVRREGVVPPAKISDGQGVVTTSDARCEDRGVQPGRRYVYAVFSRSGPLESREGTASEPVITAAEVSRLAVEAGDACASLTWKTPANVEEVIVRRSRERIEGPTDGAAVAVVSRGHAQDDGLRNDRTYHYFVCCRYRLPSGKTVYSEGLRRTATPTRAPDELSELHAEVEGRHITLIHPAVDHGTVTVVRCARPPKVKPGDLLPAARLAKLGCVVQGAAPGRVIDTAPDPAEPYYMAFVVAGDRAVAGPSAFCVVAPPVANLRARTSSAGIRLTWEWPEGCTSVIVSRRLGSWSAAPDAPEAERLDVALKQYDNDRGSFLDKVAPDPQPYCYTVYARVSGAAEPIYSAGKTEGERCRVVFRERGSLNYRVSVVGDRLRFWRKALHIQWRVEKLPPEFTGFAIIGNVRQPPRSTRDGFEVFRWEAQAGGAQGEQEYNDRVALRAIVGLPESSRQLYCKAFFLSADDKYLLGVIHPDVSQPLDIG